VVKVVINIKRLKFDYYYDGYIKKCVKWYKCLYIFVFTPKINKTIINNTFLIHFVNRNFI